MTVADQLKYLIKEVEAIEKTDEEFQDRLDWWYTTVQEISKDLEDMTIYACQLRKENEEMKKSYEKELTKLDRWLVDKFNNRRDL